MSGEPVLRGVQVAAAPLRLRRDPAAAVLAPAGSPLDAVFASAREEGRAQGAKEGHAQGRAAGHQEGLQAGRAEAVREGEMRVKEAVAQATAALQEQQARLSALVATLSATHAQVVSVAEEDLAALCLETVTRIVPRAAVSPKAVRAAVHRAITSLQRQPRVLLRLHPQDAALLDSSMPPQDGHGPAITWRADDSVALGGCLVESPAGVLDQRLETMLAECRAALLRARAQRSAGAGAGDAA